MSSRQIQIVVGLLVVIAIGFALFTVADRNREKLAVQMEAEKVAALAEAKANAEKAEAAAAAEEEAAPSFDVARFEPTGDGVLAGLAKPGALLELLANGNPIASTSANDVGEWVIVLEKPLKPGNYDLSLRATASGAEPVASEEFIVVLIPDSSTGDVLVVASRPGQASEILARPEAAAKPETSPADAVTDAVEVAAADVQPQSETVAPPAEDVADDVAVSKPIENTTAVETSTADTSTADTSTAETNTSDTAAADASPAETMPAEDTKVAVAEPQSVDAVEAPATGTAENTESIMPDKPVVASSSDVAEQPENDGTSSVETAGSDAADSTMAEVDAADSADAGTATAAMPTETGDMSAEDGVVQDKVQEMAVASAELQAPETTVAEASETAAGPTAVDDVAAMSSDAADATDATAGASGADAKPAEEMVADQAGKIDEAGKPTESVQETAETSVDTEVAAVSPDVVSQSDVTSEAVPEVAPDVAAETTSETEAPAVDTQITRADDAIVTQPEEQQVVEKPRLIFPLALDAVETEGDMVYAAGTSNAGNTVRIYVDDAYIGETVTGDDGRWLLETPASIAAGNVTVRADELEAGDTDVVRRAEVPFLKQADAIALLPTSAKAGGGASGEASAESIAAPKSVIIRTGDNLWTISRRTYGRGIRYTTIYKANDDQIRNPHMIFPGQVFVLPEGEKTWTQ